MIPTIIKILFLMFEHQKELNKTTPESEETIIVIEERISEELKFLENLYYEFNQIDENKTHIEKLSQHRENFKNELPKI